jgi:NADH-ubiquinone oxidoreductase chain 5
LYENSDTLVVIVLVILAAITKRAQIPFSAWLPAAMAAPTPVSSLVHSSTLVTAGVYLLIRFNELVGTNIFLLYVSVLTILISGVGANLEMDLKKIIALSTLSQLGVIIITLSLGIVELTFFHLISHALFKSLLFLCAGAYIHGYGDIQDIRYLGGVGGNLPVTSLFFVGCSLSLCGFPFLSGFYSKDLILESYFMSEINFFLFLLVVTGTIATITYSIRLVFYMFVKNLGVGRLTLGGEDIQILVPMSALFTSSTLAGAGFSWGYLFPIRISLPLLFKTLILSVGAGLSVVVFKLIPETSSFLQISYPRTLFFLGGMWGLPILSTVFFIRPVRTGRDYLKF